MPAITMQVVSTVDSSVHIPGFISAIDIEEEENIFTWRNGLAQELLSASTGMLEKAVKAQAIDPVRGSIHTFTAADSRMSAVALAGVKQADIPSYHNEGVQRDKLRQGLAAAFKALEKQKSETVYIDLDALAEGDETLTDVARLCAEVAEMALWQFTTYKSDTKNEGRTREIVFVTAAEDIDAVKKAVDTGQRFGKGCLFARKLSWMPPNDLYPQVLAEKAIELADRYGWKATVLDEKELEKQGLLAHLGVGRGSEHPPRLIILDSDPDGGTPVSLIGKGITFDSGGISIKPGANMHHMKADMAGSAAVLGAAEILGASSFATRLIVAVAAAENMPGTGAQRPGDIVKAYDGTTIEILNTDAEGRLVLADAIAYIRKKYQPSLIIDAATLTGAVSIALGQWAIGLMSTDDDLAEGLVNAGISTFERVWRLPLFSEYDEQLKSIVADLTNLGGREAGTITAGHFLRRFAGDTPWAHLDIAGVDWLSSDRPYAGKGPSGAGARLLAEYLLSR